MKEFFKDNWKFLLFVVIVGLIGGYFTGLYAYDSLSAEMLKQIQEQGFNRSMYAIVTTVQSGLYGLVLGTFGIILSKKVGLWKKFKFEKKAIITTIIISVIGGLVLYPGDNIIFGSFVDFIRDSFATKPSINYLISSLLYGGIIEEVMLRLFFMSLVTFIIYKLFYKKEKEVPIKVFVISNIISALVFALGHLPATMAMTSLTPLIVIRCLIMNGGYGLVFGYLYRKYGIGYSMLAHGLCHFISKILMFIFI